MKFTQIPVNAFKNVQMNAGILVDSFTPNTMVIGNIIGATSGGVNFKATPEFKDYGEDIDNCPKDTMELKKLVKWDVKMGGSFVTVTTASAKQLCGGADIDSSDANHIVPRRDLKASDFKDLWLVGDYSDVNDGTTAGFCAIHMKNSLSTGGFSIQTNDQNKGTFAFEFTGHSSIENQNEVPFEIFIKTGATK